MQVGENAQAVRHQRHLRRLTMSGAVLIALFGGTVGLWAATAALSGAVVATGQFVVDGSLKKVQHPDGGTVGELRVRDGDRVEEGDLLIRLDETLTRANLQLVTEQLNELVGRQSRLEAERDGTKALNPRASSRAAWTIPSSPGSCPRSGPCSRPAARRGRRRRTSSASASRNRGTRSQA